MGGNALKKVETRRVDVTEYPTLCEDVLNQLKQQFPLARFAIPEAVRDKMSFGDIDIVACNMVPAGSPLGAGNQWHTQVIDQFQPADSFLNSNVFSFEYKKVQIDIICVPEESFDFTLKYLSFNDLGGLMHVITKHYGFYLGQSGLRYKVYADTAKSDLLANVLVTDNFEEALDLFGFDVKRYQAGFASLPDMFDFVKANPYYDPALYLFENRNNQDKFRDQKRKTYMSFLATVEQELKGKASAPVEVNAPNFFFNACVQNDAFLSRYHIAVKQAQQVKLFMERWNYQKIASAFQLSGKDFKTLWQTLVAYVFKDWQQFRQYILSTEYSEDALFELITNTLREGLDADAVYQHLKKQGIPLSDRNPSYVEDC